MCVCVCVCEHSLVLCDAYLLWFVLDAIVWAREAVSLGWKAESKLLWYKWKWHRISLSCKFQ